MLAGESLEGEREQPASGGWVERLDVGADDGCAECFGCCGEIFVSSGRLRPADARWCLLVNESVPVRPAGIDVSRMPIGYRDGLTYK